MIDHSIVIVCVIIFGFIEPLHAQFESSSAASENYAFTEGPGAEMTKMINRLGLGSDCGRCKALAARMNEGGPVWVRENFDFVVSQTISNAERIGYHMGPIRRLGVRSIVNQAILRSRIKSWIR
ncbi:MAG: hypothetical protein AAGA30_02205 [Planctomycetota bacterium]